MFIFFSYEPCCTAVWQVLIEPCLLANTRLLKKLRFCLFKIWNQICFFAFLRTIKVNAPLYNSKLFPIVVCDKAPIFTSQGFKIHSAPLQPWPGIVNSWLAKMTIKEKCLDYLWVDLIFFYCGENKIKFLNILVVYRYTLNIVSHSVHVYRFYTELITLITTVNFLNHLWDHALFM